MTTDRQLRPLEDRDHIDRAHIGATYNLFGDAEKTLSVLWAALISLTTVHCQSVLVVTVVVRKHCGSPLGPPSTRLPAGLTYSTSARSHNGVSSGQVSRSNTLSAGSRSKSRTTSAGIQSPQSYFSTIAGYQNTTSPGYLVSSPSSIATNLTASLSSTGSISSRPSNG